MSTTLRAPRCNRVVIEADCRHRPAVRPHEGWLRRPRRVGWRAEEEHVAAADEQLVGRRQLGA
eukprot:scaffold65354_cov84-Phaeocystis_antarctica.AAC.1